MDEYVGLWPAADIAMPYLRRKSERRGGEGIAIDFPVLFPEAGLTMTGCTEGKLQKKIKFDTGKSLGRWSGKDTAL